MYSMCYVLIVLIWIRVCCVCVCWLVGVVVCRWHGVGPMVEATTIYHVLMEAHTHTHTHLYRGEVVVKAGEKEDIAYGDVDLEFLESVRKQIPVTQQRRLDLYSLSSQISH